MIIFLTTLLILSVTANLVMIVGARERDGHIKNLEDYYADLRDKLRDDYDKLMDEYRESEEKLTSVIKTVKLNMDIIRSICTSVDASIHRGKRPKWTKNQTSTIKSSVMDIVKSISQV